MRDDQLRDAMNAHLRPSPIAVLAARAVGDDFDARFSATKRHYLYRIVNRRAPLTYDFGRAWLVKRRLDADAMHEAAQLLLGNHDFSTFRATECQAKSRSARWTGLMCGASAIEILASAQSFLHRQVRSMVGSLEHVGSGKWRVEDLRHALEARDRARCRDRCAAPQGLYLVAVDY